MENKVLIIAYYWPPSGGSGVQRWLKFVKYLPGFGWTPYVFTPENPSFGVLDESLASDIPIEAEVIRFPIWEPYELFFKLSSLFGKKKTAATATMVAGKEMSLAQKLSAWIRGNFFIPDPRIFWVRPSVRFLRDFLKANEIRTIVTTGPPHSMHLIGYSLKKKNPSIRWIADFRDPWSEWGLLDSLLVGSLARKVHRRMERRVLRLADEVITITPFYVERFRSLAERNVTLLTNGYDEDDFKDLSIQDTKKFVIRHVGTINEKCDPRPFMFAAGELALANEEFRNSIHIDFVGSVHPAFISFVNKSPLLTSITTFTPPVSHHDLIGLYGQSSLLLLVLTGYKDAAGYMPGKLFEYIATGLPILGTGPEDGDAATLLRNVGSGAMIIETDTSRIKQFVLGKYDGWKNKQHNEPASAASSYSRKALTHQLTELL